MLNMRVWCHDPSSDQNFCDGLQLNSTLFSTSSSAAEVIYRLYAREAPHIEVIKVVELMLIEQAF